MVSHENLHNRDTSCVDKYNQILFFNIIHVATRLQFLFFLSNINILVNDLKNNFLILCHEFETYKNYKIKFDF